MLCLSFFIKHLSIHRNVSILYIRPFISFRRCYPYTTSMEMVMQHLRSQQYDSISTHSAEHGTCI